MIPTDYLDKVIALETTPTETKIVSRNSIDHSKIKDFTCRILEGAKEAFKKRAEIYGIK